MARVTVKQVLFAALFLSFIGSVGLAQIEHVSIRPLASNVIVPQSRARAFGHGPRRGIEITGVKVLIDILETTATTTIEIRLENRSNRRQEAELLLPVPDDLPAIDWSR